MAMRSSSRGPAGRSEVLKTDSGRSSSRGPAGRSEILKTDKGTPSNRAVVAGYRISRTPTPELYQRRVRGATPVPTAQCPTTYAASLSAPSKRASSRATMQCPPISRRSPSPAPKRASVCTPVPKRAASCTPFSRMSSGTTSSGLIQPHSLQRQNSEDLCSVRGKESESRDHLPPLPKKSSGPIKCSFTEEFSWGRNFAKYIGHGYIPERLMEKLDGLELIEQLFVIRHEMKIRIRYELGRETIRRAYDKRGRNKPVTFASNIWNRGYANCAGHCVVFAAVLQKLGVPYCIVAVKSPKKGVPKHAIVEVGFPESVDTRSLNGRAHELWTEYYGRKMFYKRDFETQEVTQIKMFTGLKFTYSAPGSEAAKKKGVGRWLWVDPQAKVGYYHRLIEQGYIVQAKRGFSFAMPPEIKTWREIETSDPSEGAGMEPIGDEEDEQEEEDDDSTCRQVPVFDDAIWDKEDREVQEVAAGCGFHAGHKLVVDGREEEDEEEESFIEERPFEDQDERGE